MHQHMTELYKTGSLTMPGSLSEEELAEINSQGT
jgi:hypothetical protein